MKKPKSQKKKRSGAIIAAIIITAISASAIYLYTHQQKAKDFPWEISGPFKIDKSQYKLGENVFMVVTGLSPSDAGKIVVYDPNGGVFTQSPFNGTMKSDFNYYFKPNTVKTEKLCTPQDLVGNWTIVFQGSKYKPLKFQVINEWIEGSQKEIKPINPC